LHNLGFSILEITCLFYKILASPSSGLMITIPIMEPNSMSHPYGKWTLAGGAAHIVTFIVIHLTILYWSHFNFRLEKRFNSRQICVI